MNLPADINHLKEMKERPTHDLFGNPIEGDDIEFVVSHFDEFMEPQTWLMYLRYETRLIFPRGNVLNRRKQQRELIGISPVQALADFPVHEPGICPGCTQRWEVHGDVSLPSYPLVVGQ